MDPTRPWTALEVSIDEEKKAVKTAKARYEECLAANRKVRGAIAQSTLRCLKLEWELAQLRLEYAELQTRLGLSQSQPGQ